MMRVFLAIPLSKEIKEKISELQKDFNLNGIKLVKKENLHVTLRFFGELNEKKIREIKKALSYLNIPPFKMEIGELGIFPNFNFIRVIWLGIKSKELLLLKGEIDKCLEQIGFRKEFNWEPHLTIARVKFLVDKQSLLKKIKTLKSQIIGVEKVERIVLYESILRRGGPIYKELFHKFL